MDEKQAKKIDFCIVGESTSSEKLSDTIKIGIKSSATLKLICHGKQGHVAYPDLEDYPIYKMVSILSRIKNTSFDTGNKYFQPSHCEITTIDVGNNTNNLMPSSIAAGFNVGNNNTQTTDVLYKMIDAICTNVTNDYKLSMQSIRNVFLFIPDRNTNIMLDAINKITGIDAVLSTNGCTPDAAFIKDICPVIEIGMINKLRIR